MHCPSSLWLCLPIKVRWRQNERLGALPSSIPRDDTWALLSWRLEKPFVWKLNVSPGIKGLSWSYNTLGVQVTASLWKSLLFGNIEGTQSSVPGRGGQQAKKCHLHTKPSIMKNPWRERVLRSVETLSIPAVCCGEICIPYSTLLQMESIQRSYTSSTIFLVDLCFCWFKEWHPVFTRRCSTSPQRTEVGATGVKDGKGQRCFGTK